MWIEVGDNNQYENGNDSDHTRNNDQIVLSVELHRSLIILFSSKGVPNPGITSMNLGFISGCDTLPRVSRTHAP